jgi:hypothetical protein
MPRSVPEWADVSEWEIHKAVVNRLRYRRDLFAWHTPNGGYRGTIEAMQFKRAGVVPGVSDLIVLRSGLPPLAWELKAKKGKLSTSQERFLENVHGYGWTTMVTYGMDEAMTALEEI